ncbi:efflux RND transporter periplasmic adaptor subunit [Paraburkholderia sp. MMS20-SJTN17]|uniref:Efflux RND transporter periplasmic adaptor subunit n=1 Tax=Paraburkholderia translucens TaxID=2886945 RepID=A0ABS8K6I4_9BURK|nr:efflux RND transporter periplasmic adaptor subunit [Paraburkholderia sp. MMS20-SJTN17]MCC8400329.1 efflux RND transporter periplasmic adaptor subunit [Paraburkholderia sp. MMS20-SJTN17]
MPSSAFRLRSRAASLLIIGLPFLLAACNERQNTPTAASMPPVPVLVETVSTTAVADVVELPGRIEAVRSAEIRARVDGIVERTLYQEGTDLPANAPLFQIDPRDYRAQLEQAKAALARATSVRDNAASVVDRFKPLVGRRAVSAQEYDAALATMQQAQANVADAQAAVSLAQLRLDRCIVRTPIAGRAGRALVTEGALVSAGAATLLAQVNQLTPINAVFTQSNTAMLDIEQQIQSGTRKPTSMKHVEVQLILANGQLYNEPGFLDFADLVVDPSTGTQTVRARFANPDRTLLPGQFVRGRIIGTGNLQGIRIPERAVQIEHGVASVALVAEDGTVVRRNIDLGEQGEGRWTVRAGLKAGERLIVDGWQKVQPGQHVDARPAPNAPPAAQPSASPATASAAH